MYGPQNKHKYQMPTITKHSLRIQVNPAIKFNTSSTVTNVALHSLKYDTAVRGLRLNITGSASH